MKLKVAQSYVTITSPRGGQLFIPKEGLKALELEGISLSKHSKLRIWMEMGTTISEMTLVTGWIYPDGSKEVPEGQEDEIERFIKELTLLCMH